MTKLKLFLQKLYLKLFKREIHYINGPIALPEPLTIEEEQALSEQLVGGDEKAREKLIVHNLRLVVYIAKKFENSGVNIEDLISIGTIGLIKAIEKFDINNLEEIKEELKEIGFTQFYTFESMRPIPHDL